jgi:hypothetical protein
MPLKPLIIEKGIIQPSLGKISRGLIHTKLFRAGVLTNAGIPVPQSKTVLYERDLLRPSRLDTSKAEIKHIDADAIYFGNPQNHFGHVITGMMAYAYILLNSNYKNHKIVFIDKEPAETVKILLGHLGVMRENIITINEYTRFKSVAVIKPSFRALWLPPRFIKNVPFRIEKEFLNTFKAISRKFSDNPNTPRKVYFSRSKLAGKTILGEDKIEQVFKNNGYAIFYPEQLPLDDQIRLAANADFYACVQGTLEHHSLFMKDGATQIVMSRKSIPTNRQVLINKMQKGIKRLNLRTNVRPLGDKRTPNIIGATKDLIRFFNENKFAYSADDLEPTRQDLRDYIDRCFKDNDPRAMKYILKNLVTHHKSYWKGI